MNPKDFLAKAQAYEKALKDAQKKSVVVGLPKGEATSKVYGNGMTVLRIGAIHEFGLGNVPERSWLRMPLDVKKKEISNQIDKQFEAVWSKDRPIDKALDFVGVQARNVILEAFKTGGFGQWEQLKPYTIEKKGSAKILIDDGILRGSITYETRDD